MRNKYQRQLRNLLLASLGLAVGLAVLIGLVIEGPAAPKTLIDYLETFLGAFIALSFFSSLWVVLGLVLDPKEEDNSREE